MASTNTGYERYFIDIYMAVRKKSGWLADFVEAGYSKEDIDCLEMLDDEYKSYDPEDEVKAWSKEVERGGGDEICFLEDDGEKIKKLTEIINQDWKTIASLKKFTPYLMMRNQIKEINDKERIRDKIRARMLHKDDDAFRLTEWEIVRAREVPLDAVIGDKLKRGRMPCPFHKGKDSNFSVKGKWGRCFVCGEWCDAIKYLIQIEGRKFIDAVRELNRL